MQTINKREKHGKAHTRFGQFLARRRRTRPQCRLHGARRPPGEVRQLRLMVQKTRKRGKEKRGQPVAPRPHRPTHLFFPALSTAINYMKSGEPPSAPAASIPASGVTRPLAAAFELRNAAAAAGGEVGGAGLARGDAARLKKLEQRARIKDKNAVKAKK